MKIESSGGWLRNLSLNVAAFSSGFFTMALEMLIGRTFIPYFGATIFTWGSLISVFLLGMTVGYMLGGKSADQHPIASTVGVLFCLSAVFVLLVPLYGEDIINVILDHIEDLRYAALVAAILLACVPAALLAAIGPFCVRLLLQSKAHSGSLSGRISALVTAGSIVGTLGTSFYFIPNFGVRAIFTWLAGISLILGVLVFMSTRDRTHQVRPSSPLKKAANSTSFGQRTA